MLITVAVLLWAARLGTFLLRRIHRVGKDSRFDEFRGVLVRMFLVYSMSVRVCVSCVSVQGYLLQFSRHALCHCAALTCDLRGGAHDNGKRRDFAGCVGVPVPFASVRGQWCAVRRRVLWTTRQLQRDAQRGGCSATTLPPPPSTSSVRC